MSEAPSSERRAPRGDPAAVLMAADILQWTVAAVSKFPRHMRHGLGNRIEGALTDVLEGLVEAQYGRGQARQGGLERANRRLQVARHLTRVAVSLGPLSERQGLYLAKLFVELGMQVGGWLKSSDKTASSSPA